jgi:hypothetical protein
MRKEGLGLRKRNRMGMISSKTISTSKRLISTWLLSQELSWELLSVKSRRIVCRKS